MQQLNFSRSTLEALEKGNLEFIQYPLNYFFTRQYASYLKVPFPEQFLMGHFKPKGKK
jgi:cytoskeletal protein RodZ